MVIKIGILSDTHLIKINDHFQKLIDTCFADVSIILHAGDLTDLSVLSAFKGKEVHAVHGNMCHSAVLKSLPTKKIIEVNGVRIGLMHGMDYRHDVEDYLIREFDDVDCIVSGHTHRPVCHVLYDILFINPGSFMGSGSYGAPGTYALLEIGDGLKRNIFEVPRLV